MSIRIEGIYTILRDVTRISIPSGMEPETYLDMEKLRADMAAKVAATSGRAFSKAVTGGRNPDFYRNFVNDGQDKRLSADVFAGIVRALGRNPADYIVGMDQRFTLPSATVLTSTFAVLLASLEIDPYKDERAQKLAAQFPDALKSVADLQSRSIAASIAPPEEDAPDAVAGSSPS